MSIARLPLLLAVAALSAFAVCTGSPAAGADTGSAQVGPLRDCAFARIAIQVGEARLMIEHGTPGRSATLYFDDAALERDQARLAAQGIKFAGPIETVQRTEAFDLKLLEFPDPDGNPLALMGKVPRHN